MATTEKKKLPSVNRGVRQNASQRMVTLARPICPNSQRKRNADGSFVELGPNCQLAGGQWWIDCEERGHDPYFSSRTHYEPVDVLDDEGYVIGQKKKPIHSRNLNTAQVALSRRINSGRGVQNKMEKHGFRRISDFGYEEVCQYRNCGNPAVKKYTTPAFGAYCSYDHLTLIAASEQGILVPQINGITEGTRIEQVRAKRDDMLRGAVVRHMDL